MLVCEVVLCTKEVNKKTRAAAYALLVTLGRTMLAANPPPAPPPAALQDVSMGETDAGRLVIVHRAAILMPYCLAKTVTSL